MSNRSRARFRADHDHHTPAEPEAPADEQLAADVEDMVTAFDKGDQKAGVSKWAGLVLRDRENALTETVTHEPAQVASVTYRDEPAREPSPFEAAVLFALGNRIVTQPTPGGPIHAPVHVFSPIYGGTVEPERVAARRRRNKSARAARSGNRRRTYGHVYRSPFGYHVSIPGITDDVVDAEVVDA